MLEPRLSGEQVPTSVEVYKMVEGARALALVYHVRGASVTLLDHKLVIRLMDTTVAFCPACATDEAMCIWLDALTFAASSLAPLHPSGGRLISAEEHALRLTGAASFPGACFLLKRDSLFSKKKVSVTVPDGQSKGRLCFT